MTTTQPAAALPVLKQVEEMILAPDGVIIAKCARFGFEQEQYQFHATELVRRANAFPGLLALAENIATQDKDAPINRKWLMGAVDQSRALLSSLKQS